MGVFIHLAADSLTETKQARKEQWDFQSTKGKKIAA